MQRHPALRDLSSDDRLELVLARRSRRAAEEGAAQQTADWRELTRRLHEELADHFRREEQGLLPALPTRSRGARAPTPCPRLPFPYRSSLAAFFPR